MRTSAFLLAAAAIVELSAAFVATPSLAKNGWVPSLRIYGSDAEPAAATNLKERGRALCEQLSGVSVYLVGMMGSGKSTVGELFCKSLGSYVFLDTDSVIEQLTETSVAELFATEGEEEFRKVETAVLTQVQAYVRTVVATGGGAVTVDENWGRLQSGLVVHLDVPPAALAGRLVAQAGGRADAIAARPLLARAALGGGAVDAAAVEAELSELLEKRKNKYAQADAVVHLTGDEPLDDCAMKVIEALEFFIEANPPKWKQWKEKAKLPLKEN